MDTLEMKEIEAAVEGILFASGEPVGVDRICVALDMDRQTAEMVLQRLQDYYSYERRGIRRVDSSYTVGLLLDRHLIEECGRLQVPGRPRLYRTTQAFLRAFHLRSLEELPQLPGMEADGQLRLDEDGLLQELPEE